MKKHWGNSLRLSTTGERYQRKGRPHRFNRKPCTESPKSAPLTDLEKRQFFPSMTKGLASQRTVINDSKKRLPAFQPRAPPCANHIPWSNHPRRRSLHQSGIHLWMQSKGNCWSKYSLIAGTQRAVRQRNGTNLSILWH